MNNPLNIVLYGAYLFWKYSFYGIRDETSDKEVTFNIVCAMTLFSLMTCLLLFDIDVLLKKIEITSGILKGYEAIGSTIIFSVPVLIFLFLCAKRKKFVVIFQNYEYIRTKKYISLSFFIIYMIIPIVFLILI